MKKQGSLSELQERVNGIETTNGATVQNRKLALTALIQVQQGNIEDAELVVAELVAVANRNRWVTPDDYWPELLVAWICQRKTHTILQFEPLIDSISDRIQTQASDVDRIDHATHTQMHALAAWAQDYESSGTAKDAVNSSHGPLQSADWIFITRPDARLKATGAAPARWRRRQLDGRLKHASGHNEDLLVYRTPLIGHFEVAGEMTGYSFTQLLAASQMISANTKESQWLGNVHDGIRPTPLNPPFTFLDGTMSCRAVFSDETVDYFLNGRLVKRIDRQKNGSPWLGIRCFWVNAGGLQSFRVAGTPVVPEDVVLSENPGLDEWFPYGIETINRAAATWNDVADPEGGQIVGLHQPWYDGTAFESLLQYLRPLDVTGSVSFQFCFEPRNVVTHPAIGRIAFLIRQDGVHVHRITDGAHDLTFLSPTTESSPINPRRLPLQSGTWNDFTVAVCDRTVTLTLNGTNVGTYQLQKEVDRTFGLFHFAEESEVQVRRVTMRGSWPQDLPSEDQRELTDQRVVRFDAERAGFAATFEHQFTTSAFPEKLFSMVPPTSVRPQVTEEGLQASLTATAAWSSQKVNVGRQLHGDFNVEAHFLQLQQTGDRFTTLLLNEDFVGDDIPGDDIPGDDFPVCRMPRMRDERHRHSVQAQVTRLREGGRSYESDGMIACKMKSGALRLVRRKDKVFSLAAEGDSRIFRINGEHNVGETPTTVRGVALESSGNGESSWQVVWTDLKIAVDKLTHVPADAWTAYDCDWSTDAKRLAFVGVAPPQPVDWPTAVCEAK